MTTAGPAGKLDRQRIRKAFERASSAYDESAVLQRTVATRLMERFDLLNVNPSTVMDAGAGTGFGYRALRKRFPHAHVLALDIATSMLRRARRQSPTLFSRGSFVCADVCSLPIRDGALDVAYCCLVLQWCDDLAAALAALRRSLRAGAVLLVATLGPDTLRELREAWRSIDNRVHVHSFQDMHLLGDMLIAADFAQPVVDVETLTLTYEDLSGLVRDLRTLGVTNASADRPRGLLPRSTFSQLAAAYEPFRVSGRLPASYEVIYAHAHVPRDFDDKRAAATEARIPLAAVKRR